MPCRHAIATAASLSLAAAPVARAEAVTQACLGDRGAFLTCPVGASQVGTECRDDGDTAWGRLRHGPALTLHPRAPADPRPPAVAVAASYRDDQRAGRVFRFDREGRLAGWEDVRGDQRHGASVACSEAGQVVTIAYFSHNHPVGLQRSWTAPGQRVRLIQHDGRGHSVRGEPTPELLRRPDELCHPEPCDVGAAPDLSGVPAALR